MSNKWLLSLPLLLSALFSCENKSIPIPTYTCDSSVALVYTDVQPITQSKCAINGCHNGSRATIPTLLSQQDFARNLNDAKFQIENGAMPPSGSVDLTTFERSKILCWINSGGN